MTLYFKTSFKPLYEGNRSKRKTLPIPDLLKKYVAVNHSGLTDALATCGKA
jgi:hypothetical protein